MTTFKPGQRVKRIAQGVINVPIGSIGTVTDAVGYSGDVGVKWDSWSGDTRCFMRHTLAPLTDPGADAFIERIKKLKPEPVVPLPEKTYSEHFKDVWRELHGNTASVAPTSTKEK